MNKLDLVNYEEATFDTIAEAFEDWAARIGLSRPLIIPIAAKSGDNVSSPSENLSWWRGPTLLEALGFPTEPRMTGKSLLGLLKEGRGKHFDPDVVDTFLAAFDDFVAIAERYRDETPDA